MKEQAMAIALPFIKKEEGLRLKAYIDQGGRVTIGYGYARGVQLGDEWSLEQAGDMLAKVVGADMDAVMALVRVPINQHQLAALTSFVYNLGVGSLARSGLLRFLNLRQYEKASEQFLLWNHIGMYVSSALTQRREREMALFNTKDGL